MIRVLYNGIKQLRSLPMPDSTYISTDARSYASGSTTLNLSHGIYPPSLASSSQLLTRAYNPAVHPRQMSLPVVSGQSLLYALVQTDPVVAAQAATQAQSSSTTAKSSTMKNLPKTSACSLCGSRMP